MLRFATSRIPLVTAGACGLRFQATQNAPGARRRNFRYRPTWTLPNFVIEDVQDDPARGSMIRVAVDRKQLLVSQYPQLGPRKTEANDPTPQFDRERRVSVRMRHMDLAGLVAVVEGRLPSHHMKNNAYDLVFEKNPEGYSLKGQVHRATSTKSEEWAIQFNDHHATTIEHFLESALAASFGFEQYNAFVRQANNARQNGGNAGNNNNNYGNRRNYNNGNNNGRRNNNNNNNNNNQRQQFIQ